GIKPLIEGDIKGSAFAIVGAILSLAYGLIFLLIYLAIAATSGIEWWQFNTDLWRFTIGLIGEAPEEPELWSWLNGFVPQMYLGLISIPGMILAFKFKKYK
ncbi:MAG: hypothetical protein ACXQS8_07425, partial [Candidatus Helarchaeales archaeon]